MLSFSLSSTGCVERDVAGGRGGAEAGWERAEVIEEVTDEADEAEEAAVELLRGSFLLLDLAGGVC